MATTGHENEIITVEGMKASLQKLKTDHIDGKAAKANITAGDYNKVTVNAQGIVTGGSNPTTLAGHGITDAYTKTEVNGLVDTPHQNYVTVQATDQTTAATDVLPASGQAADTIYRVSNWDGSANNGAGAFDVTVYSEYAWDDVSNPNKYVFLAVNTQIGEVFDISVYNNNATYPDLATALGASGANVPAEIRRGGMSVKFVQSINNKYVQYRLTADDWSTDTEDWSFGGNDVYVENPEFARVVLDNESKILEATKVDGIKLLPAGVEINEKIDFEGNETTIIENPEWLSVEVDNDDKVLEGVYKDGSHYIYNLESETLDRKVDKEEGKGLSSNDFTDEYKAGVSNISSKTIEFDNITITGSSTVTRMFSEPILLSDFSEISIGINGIIAQEDKDRFYLYVYYDGTTRDNGFRIRDVVNNDKVVIPSYGHEALYGIMLYNTNDTPITANITINCHSKLSSIPSTIENDIYMRLPPYYNDYLSKKIHIISELLRKTIINGDAFYFVTDTHWEYNQEHSPAIIRQMNNTLSIPRLFHGGDMYQQTINNIDIYGTRCLNAFRRAMDNPNMVYETDGNHEYLNQENDYGDTFAEARIFLNDVVYGGANKNYYYVDNKEKKIRYISLYSYGKYIDGVITKGFTDNDQLNWFENNALNVETGWKIIIFSHFFAYGSLPGLAVNNNPDAHNVYEIIDRYNGNGKILCCIGGHAHIDIVSFDGSSKCPVVVTTCDHNYPLRIAYGGNYYIDLSDLIEKRDTGTVKEQAFDVVIYESEKEIIHFARIGSRAMNRSNSFAGDAQVDYRSVLIDGISVGTEKTLITPIGGNVSWESANTNVISVNDGVITANSSGDTVITAVGDNGEKHSFFIKVNS